MSNIIEPINLTGKTIKEAFMIRNNEKLILEFMDGTKVSISNRKLEDEITGREFYTDIIEIENWL